MSAPRPPEPNREILNIEEAALLLGVSTKTFAKVLREGEIPGRKVGREWKFSRRALIDWVASGRSADFIERDETRRGAARFESAGRPPRAGRDGRRRDEAEMSIEED